MDNFKPVPVEGGHELLLPAHVAGEVAPQVGNPGRIELHAQREVIGTHGLGSIRNESASERVDEQLEKSINGMLDPGNVIELKYEIDSSVSRAKSERTHPFIKSTDGSEGNRDAQEAQAIRSKLVEKYVQTGADPKNPREVPENVHNELNAMLNMSYAELEKKIEEKEEKLAQDRANARGENPEKPEPEPPAFEDREDVHNAMEGLRIAGDRYARETARAQHSYIGRFAQGNTWLGRLARRIPGVSGAIHEYNNNFNRELDEAKREYDLAKNGLGMLVASELIQDQRNQGAGPTEAVRRAIAYGVVFDINTEAQFEDRVAFHREGHTANSNWLVDLWVNSNGKWGKLGKFAGVAIAGGLTGGVGAVIGGAWFGAAGAAAAGGAIGGHINKRRGNARVGQDAAGNDITLIRQQQAQRFAEKKTREAQIAGVNVDGIATGGNVQSEHVTALTEQRTNEELANRRSRVRKTVSAALFGYRGPGAIKDTVDWVQDHLSGPDQISGGDVAAADARPGSSATEGPGAESNTPAGAGNSQAYTPGIDNLPSEINVEAGHGVTQEMADLAGEAGIENLNPDDYAQAYADAANHFGGPDKLLTGSEYNMGGTINGVPQVGISSPGPNAWAPGVQDFLVERLDELSSAHTT